MIKVIPKLENLDGLTLKDGLNVIVDTQGAVKIPEGEGFEEFVSGLDSRKKEKLKVFGLAGTDFDKGFILENFDDIDCLAKSKNQFIVVLNEKPGFMKGNVVVDGVKRKFTRQTMDKGVVLGAFVLVSIMSVLMIFNILGVI